MMALGPAVVACTFGQTPSTTTRSSTTPLSRADELDNAVRMRPGLLGRRQLMTEDQWNGLSSLMEKHSPYRWQIFNSIDEPSRQARIRAYIITQYRNVLDTVSSNPELHELLVRRLELEDHVFESAVELSSDGMRRSESAPERRSLREKFKGQVNELVKLGMDERRLRIRQMERTIAAQKVRLEADEKIQGEIANRRASAIMARAELFRSRMDELPDPGDFPPRRSPAESSDDSSDH